MLQFTVDQELKDVLTFGGVPTGLEIGQKITIIHYVAKETSDYRYYMLDMFLGDYADRKTAVDTGALIKLDQIPFDKMVYLYNEDRTAKYTVPQSTAVNYGRSIEENAYPLLMNMQEDVAILTDKLVSGGY